MRVLIACEFSGIVREAFAKRGHDAWSCDLEDTEISGKHIIGDVLGILDAGWDLMIAHPPCTYLTNSGVCWLYKEEGRWQKLGEGVEFFRKLLHAPVKYKAIENPIPHKYAVALIGRKYDQIVQPWQFGHAERKATCFWLEGLPELNETDNVKEEMLSLPKNKQQRLHYLPPSKERSKLRSKTFKGIADAMADQWGSL